MVFFNQRNYNFLEEESQHKRQQAKPYFMCETINWFNVGGGSRIHVSNASKIFNTFYSMTLHLRIYPKAKRTYKDVKMMAVTEWHL